MALRERQHHAALLRGDTRILYRARDIGGWQFMNSLYDFISA